MDASCPHSLSLTQLTKQDWLTEAINDQARACKQSILCTNITADQSMAPFIWLIELSPPPQRHRLQACGIDFGTPFSHALVHGRAHSCPLPLGVALINEPKVKRCFLVRARAFGAAHVTRFCAAP